MNEQLISSFKGESATEPAKKAGLSDIYNRLLFAVHQADYSLPKVREIKTSGGYLTYGEDNLYPKYLLNMFFNSALHSAIVTGKVDYIVGNGLVSASDNKKVNSFIAECNNKGDTLDDVFRKCALDNEIFGGFALQVIYEKGGGKIAELYYVDFSKFRFNLEADKLKYARDWSMSRVKTIEYDMYDESKPEGTQIFYYNGEITREQYPTPIYVGSIAAIETDIEISNFHLNVIKSGMFPSLMIDFKNGEPTEEEKAYIERKFKEKWGGTSNAGKMIMSFSDADNPSPEIIPIEQPDLDKRFIVLQDSVRDRIFVGHRITTPALFGVQTQGKLGNVNEFNQGYQIFQKSYVKPTQKVLLRIFNRILSNNFKEADLIIREVEPLDMMFTNESIIAGAMTLPEIRENLKKWGYIEDVVVPPGMAITGQGIFVPVTTAPSGATEEQPSDESQSE